MVRKCVVCGTRQVKTSPYSFHSFPRAEERHHAWRKACRLGEETVTHRALVCSKHFKEDDYDSLVWTKRKLLPTAVPAPSLHYRRVNNPSISIEPKTEPIDLKEGLITSMDSSEVASVSFEVTGQSTPVSLVTEISGSIEPKTEPIDLKEGIITSMDTSKVAPISFAVVGPSKQLLPSREISESNENVRHLESPLTMARYVGDLTPEHFSTPQRAARSLLLVKEELSKHRVRTKVLAIQKKRLERRIDIVKVLLERLREENMLPEQAFLTIMASLYSSRGTGALVGSKKPK